VTGKDVSRKPVAVSRRAEASRTADPLPHAIHRRNSQTGNCNCQTLRLSGYRLPATGYRTRGFTLIELIAAFVIFALGFGVLLQILGGSLHTTTQSVDESKAAMWAQTVLDTQGIGEPLEEGTSRGRFDDQYSWELRVQKYDPPPAQTTVAPIGSASANGLITQVTPNLDMFQLELVVSWGNQFLMHRAHFATVRVMNPPQLPGNGANPQPPAPARAQR
jgi:general secretion pathway protein I